MNDPFNMDPYANGRLDEIHAMLTKTLQRQDALRDTNRDLWEENTRLKRENKNLRAKRTASLTKGVRLSKAERELIK